MTILARSFDLCFVDPPGTGPRGEPCGANFADVVESIGEGLARFGRNLILVGHSYGGVYAGALALRNPSPTRGLVFIGSALLPQAWPIINDQYSNLAPQSYKEAADAFAATPSAESYREIILQCTPMFFSASYHGAGRALLERDEMNWQAPIAHGTDPSRDESFVRQLAELPSPKLFIAGHRDLVLPPDFGQTQAQALGAEFAAISSGHFPTFEQPGLVARLIESSSLRAD